jgi:ABC-type antimicrobial peptide transport system permease subunit
MATTAPTASVDQRQNESGVDYEVGLESLGQWQIAARKFRRHRLAMIGLVILACLVAAAILGPIFMPFNYNTVPQPDVIVPAGRPPTWLANPPTFEHIFGETGGLQRDVFQLTVNGAATSPVWLLPPSAATSSAR